MAWPAHQLSTFKPTSVEWNAIVDALQTAQGAYNGNGQVASGWLQINIQPTADTDALVISPAPLVSAGIQFGGRLKLRASAYDTSAHTRDFVWQAFTSSNAGAGYTALLTSLDGAALSELIRFDASQALGVFGVKIASTRTLFQAASEPYACAVAYNSSQLTDVFYFGVSTNGGTPGNGNFGVADGSGTIRFNVSSSGVVAIGIGTVTGTVSGTGKVHFSGNTARIVDASRTPANSAAAGNDGEVCMDNGFIYIHTGGSWRKVAVATF